MDRPAANSEDKEQLNKLTIVVPTYGRPNHVLQTVKFWSGRGPKLLVLDGSPTPVKEDQLFENVEGLTYVHLPESIPSRLAHSAGYIRTDYVTLMGDDEVHMPSSLAASIKELEGNPELASCLGWAVGFKSIVGKGSITEILGIPGYQGLHFLESNQKSARERWIAHFGQYVPSNIYSVVRADAYRNAVKLIGLPGERVYSQSEVEYEIAVLYQGGNRVLPNLHWLRNCAASVNYAVDPDTNPEKQFHECFLSPEYSVWKEEFLSTRSQILAAIDGQEVAQVRLWLEDALQLYSDICAENRSTPTRAAQLSFFLRKCLHTFIPADQRYKVRKILSVLAPKDPGPSLPEVVRDLSLSGMNYSIDELSEVIEERLKFC